MAKRRVIVSGAGRVNTGTTDHARTKALVKSLIGQNIEHKRATTQVGTTATSAGVIQALTQFIVEGDGISQRTGRLINMVETDLRYMRDLQVINGASTLRCIVFLDTQNQGVLPAVTDVLAAAGPAAGWEVQNMQQHRFKILHDCLETLCDASTSRRKVSHIKIDVKYQIHYGGATDVAASNRRNAMFVLYVTDNLSLGPVINLGVDHRYTDA